MDSMRSLNTSLPASSPYPQPPEQLLQAFKTAALSVTNLYKTAVADQSQARQAGYQEAIEDLLSFLDRENLGLGDGEGWKVRQWATERTDGTGVPTGESEDERGDSDKRGRSSSPVVARKGSNTECDVPSQLSQPTPLPRGETSQDQHPPQQQQHELPTQGLSQTQQIQPHGELGFPRQTTFTFTSGPQLPQPSSQDVDMQAIDNTLSMSSLSPGDLQTFGTSNLNTSSVSVSVMPRSSRTPHRHSSNTRHNPRSSTRETSSSLGSKRKLPFSDFFDLSGLNGRDFLGGKRSRFI